MGKTAYVNGQFVDMQAAQVNIEDRGYQFADGAYEVCTVANGRLLDGDPHVRRLHRSLAELKIPTPDLDIRELLLETAQRNQVDWGIVYIQVTRGVAPRNHAFPDTLTPAVVITSRPLDYQPVLAGASQGKKVITTPEIRWRRCDIKSISLLPNILAKQQAREAGAFEAWFVTDEGEVTEGSSTNAWISNAGTVVTHPASHAILNGIVRQTLIELMENAGIRVEQRPFTLEEAKWADGAFVTSTTACVTPVSHIDDTTLGDGSVDNTVQHIASLYRDYIYAAAE